MTTSTTTFRYPTGARPLLIEETARRRRIESGIVALLDGAGFAEIVLPIIDFAEPYAGIIGREKQSYRFTDREGELVTLRSDFTPMVARALAPLLCHPERREGPGWDGAPAPRRPPAQVPRDARDDIRLPLRVFYRGDVVRCEATRLGANREMFQIGAEIVGDPSPEADLEMLRLAQAVAQPVCSDPLIVYADGPQVDDPRFVRHDEEGDRGYYTGIRFWVYGDDRRTPIARGGRYDSLYERFGAGAPAIGFTFTVD